MGVLSEQFIPENCYHIHISMFSYECNIQLVRIACLLCLINAASRIETTSSIAMEFGLYKQDHSHCIAIINNILKPTLNATSMIQVYCSFLSFLPPYP